MTSTSEISLASRTDGYPLLQVHTAGDTIAWRNARAITAKEFLGDVLATAASLPSARYAINLCEDRYWFLVGFAALLINQQTNLLPPNRAVQVITEIAEDYPGAYCLCDSDNYAVGLPVHRIDADKNSDTQQPYDIPYIPAHHLAAISFTSGSTGKASAHMKHWQDLVTGSRMLQARFAFQRHTIIATVPPQHMYGLETSILNPLINGVSISTDRTFFPMDICSALDNVDGRRVLITTPVHMKSCVQAAIDWPAIDFIVSATAPLDKTLASRAESAFNCPVMEIYGCTEAGSLASRRTARDKNWLLYDDSSLEHKADGYYVSGPNLPDDILLHDVIDPISDREFALLGRNSDMINIAGKRASLDDLNIRLNRIEGVEDAVFIVPESGSQTGMKLAALVVAPSLSPDHIRHELALTIDPVFLPRPLYLVDSLPRDATGKLPRSALLAMLEHMRKDD